MQTPDRVLLPVRVIYERKKIYENRIKVTALE